MFPLIVGLGNIGKKYIGTRHNLGFEVVDLVIKKTKAKSLPSEYFYQSFDTTIEEYKIVFAKPTTMMNGSGEAVVTLLDKFDLRPTQMLVIVDDFNIPLGTIRLRPNGSDGGHNGLESIIQALGSEDFPRLRLGIGPVTEGLETVNFVLGKFTKTEEKTAKKMIEMAAEAVIFAAGHRLEESMSKFNYNPA